MEYRDFINTNMNDVITALNGSITPAPVNSELYRDFINRKADDVITALNGSITPEPAGDELYRDFIERKFDDVIAGIGGYVPPISFPTLTGSIVTFNSQYAGLPLKSHKIALTATQSGSGTPSPSNPRPITGYSAINISHSDADTSNPTVYTIQIGSTVYGGEYDAKTGLFMATHKGVVFDGSESWEYWSDNSCFFLNNALDVDNEFRTDNVCLCNWLAESSSITNSSAMNRKPDLIFCNQTSFSQRLWVKMTQFTTETDFKNYLSSNNLVIVYPLSTPTTIQLPPCPIDTLEGQNNIWADTGNTTLQYPKFG